MVQTEVAGQSSTVSFVCLNFLHRCDVFKSHYVCHMVVPLTNLFARSIMFICRICRIYLHLSICPTVSYLSLCQESHRGLD